MALLSIGEILDLGNSANMSSYIPYSALDYDPTGAISGISGSAIAGGVESSVVSSIVSSMVSSKADQSALEDCCSSMSSVVSSIQNDVSGISSYVSGLTGEYLEKSASSMFAPSGNYMSASESSSFYPMTGNPSGFLTSVDLSNYATTDYVDSSVSGKMDATASGYLQPSGDYAFNSSLTSYIPFSSVSGESNLITAINGSALAGQGGGASVVVTGTAWDSSTSAYVYDLSSKLSAAGRYVWTQQNGNKLNYIEYLKDDSGNSFPMMASFLAPGAEQMYYSSFDPNGRLQFSPSKTMFSADGSNVYGLSPLTYATGASMNLSAGYFRASYRGDTIFISRGPTGTIDSSNSSQIKAVRIEAHNSRGANISAYGAYATGYYSDTGMRLSHSGVFVDDSGNSSNTASNLTLTTGSITFYSAGSSDVMRQSSIPYWNAKLDSSAIECDTASAITAIGGSAIAGGGGGGIDSATCSAIASAYAESAVSSYVPYSALESADGVITAISGTAIGGGGTGVEYSGIAPVVVNNTSHKISADTINFVLDSSLSGNLSNSQYTLSINKEAYSPVQVVSSTSLATANGVIYVVSQ